MIKRVLLLKLVSWVVLSPVFALGPDTACAHQRDAPFFGPFAKVGASSSATDGPHRSR